MTQHVKFVTKMASLTALPKDEVEVSMSFAFPGGVPSNADHVALNNVVSAFWNVVTSPQTHVPAEYLSPEIDRTAGATTYLIYNYPATRGALGSPVYTAPGTLNAPLAGTVALPGQDALVLSFHADLTGILETGPTDTAIPSTESAIDQGAPTTHTGIDRMRSRRRGRIYIGPLNDGLLTHNTQLSAIVSSTATTDVHLAASKLATDAAAAGWFWEVFSRRDWQGYDVVGGWIDNRFDTQRRRLETPGIRTLWT